LLRQIDWLIDTGTLKAKPLKLKNQYFDKFEAVFEDLTRESGAVWDSLTKEGRKDPGKIPESYSYIQYGIYTVYIHEIIVL
jgi:hypothetical protein